LSWPTSFQDTTRAQFKLLKHIVDHHRNLAVVGDPKQCFPPGTSIQTPSGNVPIESLGRGEVVVAAAGCGATTSAPIQSATHRQFDGDLVQVTLKSGAILRLTPDHMCFSRLGVGPDVLDRRRAR
jgi:DNA helicase-2/ATP-dependent DNA helicase PcrA